MLNVPITPEDASRFPGRRCVVTGGLGFIGSNLANWLSAAGASVTVIDSLVPSHGGARRNLEPLGSNPIDVVVADIEHDAAQRAARDLAGGSSRSMAVTCDVSIRASVEDVQDLDGDGIPELLTVDNRFAYFPDLSFASSPFLPLGVCPTIGQ